MTSKQPFRLLRAELEDQDGASVDVDFASRNGDGSWTTLVTGRNGSGKSRLLSAVAGAFDALDGRHLRRRDPITVEYLFGEHECSFRVGRGKIAAFIDGRLVETEMLPRPSTVAAATASAFDKFHLPREARMSGQSPTDSRYRYLGLKDARGRISARAGVFRALEQLFDVSAETHSRRQRVADVFRYLGYNPTVEVTYAWTFRGRELVDADETLSTRAVEQYLQKEKTRGISSARSSVPNYFFEEATAAKELATSLEALRKNNGGPELRLVADFRQPNPGGEDQLRMARQLMRAGLVQMAEVALWLEPSNRRVEITDASSGQLSLVVTMLGIASSIENGSLILIDEPEISLHPQWQAEYLGRLEQVFAAYRDCHFIIATHSPTLVAGAGRNRTSIVNLEGLVTAASDTPSGRSIDEVLLNSFGVVSENSLYLRDLLVAALRGAEDGELALPTYDEDMASLEAARGELAPGNPIAELIDRLLRIRAQLANRSQS